jgi:hypothetical protein
MQSDASSNAELIRIVANENGSHTNRWIKEQLEAKYKRIVSIQQIQQVLGTTKERGFRFDKYVLRKAADLIQACGYDHGLAVMVVADLGRVKK